MKYKVYIDGQDGTTGLQLRQRLEKRSDIELLLISEELRKDRNERKKLMNKSDVVFLCLPDDAAKEAVKLIENENICVIDASTAHRVNPDWTYGFSELSPSYKNNIKNSKRISNPGCHATGFISLVYPLIELEVVEKSYPFCCFSLTGYSGGGKSMIADYEKNPIENSLLSPRQYGLSQEHKHLSEMQKITGIEAPPIFTPIVSNFYGGMATTIFLHTNLMKKKLTKEEVYNLFQKYYLESKFIDIYKGNYNFLPANLLVGTNKLIIFIEGNDERITLTAVFDNLGKGASGAAVQNMNIALGLDENTELN